MNKVKTIAALIITTALVAPFSVPASAMQMKMNMNIQPKAPIQTPVSARPNVVKPQINVISSRNLARRTQANKVASAAPDTKAGRALQRSANSGSSTQRKVPTVIVSPDPLPRLEREDTQVAVVVPLPRDNPFNNDRLREADDVRDLADIANADVIGFDRFDFAPAGFDDPLAGDAPVPADEFAGTVRPAGFGGQNQPDAMDYLPDMGSNGDGTSTGEFTKAVFGTPDDLIARGVGGVASQDGSITIDLGGGASLHSTETADGTYHQNVIVPNADGSTTHRSTVVEPDGFAVVHTTVTNSDGRIVGEKTEYRFNTPNLDQLLTGDENGGSGILVPNCGSAACNAMRDLLNDPEGALRDVVARGTNGGISRDGADHGVPQQTRIVSAYDLVSQPDPNATTGSDRTSGGSGPRFHDMGKHVNPGTAD